MRIAGFCGPDTGGQNHKLCEAINGHTIHEARDFRRSGDYLAFSHTFQLDTDKDNPDARAFLGSIDIAHVHSKGYYKRLWGETKDCPAILHFHGRQGDKWQAVRDDAHKQFSKVIVSTINLLPLVFDDEKSWFPAPFDVDALQSLRNESYLEHQTYRVAHSPTRRDYKGTDILANTIGNLKATGVDIELVLIEGKSHDECLKIKATCDATFDQFYLCLGNSGLESMCMGHAVLCGMPEGVLKRYGEIVKEQPFIYVTPETLATELMNLIEAPAYHRHWSARGLAYVREWHDYPVAAARAIKLYEGVL